MNASNPNDTDPHSKPPIAVGSFVIVALCTGVVAAPSVADATWRKVHGGRCLLMTSQSYGDKLSIEVTRAPHLTNTQSNAQWFVCPLDDDAGLPKHRIRTMNFHVGLPPQYSENSGATFPARVISAKVCLTYANGSGGECGAPGEATFDSSGGDTTVQVPTELLTAENWWHYAYVFVSLPSGGRIYGYTLVE